MDNFFCNRVYKFTNIRKIIIKRFWHCHRIMGLWVQVANAVRNCSESSLVLLDEFGAGTHSVYGQALLTATLRHFLRRACPHIVVSTHYHSIITQQLIPPSRIIRYQVSDTVALWLYIHFRILTDRPGTNRPETNRSGQSAQEDRPPRDRSARDKSLCRTNRPRRTKCPAIYRSIRASRQSDDNLRFRKRAWYCPRLIHIRIPDYGHRYIGHLTLDIWIYDTGKEKRAWGT